VPKKAVRAVKVLRQFNEKYTQIFAGYQITAVVSSYGNLYTWGSNEHRLLGTGEKKIVSSPNPKLVDLPGCVLQVAFGRSHCLARLEDGRMYSWGENKFGQCGVGNLLPIEEPSLVFCDEKSVFIACGDNHSGCVTATGKLYVWGRRQVGLCIDITSVHFSRPVRLDHPDHCYWTGMSISQDCIIGISKEGFVWQWSTDKIGIPPDESKPVLVLKNTGSSIYSGKSHLLIGVEGTNKVSLELAAQNAEKVLCYLLDNKIDALSATDDSANTIFHHGALSGDVNLIHFLYKNVDPKQILKVNSFGQTPIHIAADKGNRELIPVLDKYGVLIDATDSNGDTALHLAVRKNDLKTIEVLLQTGADVDATDKQLKTPMHYVVNSEWDILDIIAKAGPNLDAKDINGRSVLLHTTYTRSNILRGITKPNGFMINAGDTTQFSMKLSRMLAGHGIRLKAYKWISDFQSIAPDIQKNHSICVVVLSPALFQSESCYISLQQIALAGLKIVPVLRIENEVTKSYSKMAFGTKIVDLSHDAFEPLLPKFIKKVTQIMEAYKENPERKPIKLVDSNFKFSTTKKTAAKGVRIFVSSTFKDMGAERELLVKNVFPRLHALCSSKHINFSFVDLRWGITKEMSEGGQAISACLDEVEYSYPFFISMLGERYGWHLGVGDDELFQSSLDSAIISHPWVKSFQDRSVTELEIISGALRWVDWEERAVDYIEQIVENQVFVKDEEWRMKREKVKAFFWLRHPAYIESVPSGQKTDYYVESFMAKEKIENLKTRINASGFPVSPYRVLRDFETSVYNTLSSAITSMFSQEQISHEEIELRAHMNFIDNQAKFYGEIDYDIRRVHAFINNSTTSKPLIIGCRTNATLGKTTLLSAVAKKYHSANPYGLVAFHFVGASERSYYHWEICRNIMYQMKKHWKVDRKIPEQKEELVAVFRLWIEEAQERGGMIMILDGLDKMSTSEQAHELDWLPSCFSTSVRVLLSSSNSETIEEAVRKYGWTDQHKLDVLPERFVTSITRTYLNHFGKKLNDTQLTVLQRSKTVQDPTALRIILEELCATGSFETLDNLLREYASAPRLPDLYNKVLQRWEDDEHGLGRDNVTKVLSSLVCTTQGLEEYELLDFTEASHVCWTMLSHYLGTRLTIQNGLVSLPKGSLASFISKRYQEYITTMRLPLAKYLSSKPLTLRTIREIAFLYINSSRYDKLCKFLSKSVVLKTLYTDEYKYELCQWWKDIAGNGAGNAGEAYLNTISLLRSNPDADRREIGELYYLAAEMMRLMASFQLSQDLYLKALVVQEELLFSDTNKQKHLFVEPVVLSLNGIAQVEEKLSEYEKSEKHLLNAIGLVEQYLNAEHPCLGDPLCFLSGLYGLMVKLDLSESIARRALRIAEKHYGNYHLDTANALKSLSIALKKQQKYAASIEPLQRALRIRQKLLGPTHFETASIISSLGNLYAKQKMWEEALTLYHQVGDIQRGIFGLNHPVIAQNKYNIGRLLEKQGRNHQAYQYLMEAWNISHANYGNDGILTQKIEFQIFKVLKVNDEEDIYSRFESNTYSLVNWTLRSGYMIKGPDGRLKFNSSQSTAYWSVPSSFAVDKKYEAFLSELNHGHTEPPKKVVSKTPTFNYYGTTYNPTPTPIPTPAPAPALRTDTKKVNYARMQSSDEDEGMGFDLFE